MIEDTINVSPLFKNKKVIDVLYEYLPTVVINLPESFKEYGDYRYAYFSVFDLMNWKPMVFGTWKGKIIQFRNMGLNAVYLPVFYKEEVYIFLKQNKEKLRKVRLRKKFVD